jgi:preprotein translocase subunit YajC
MKPRRPRSKTAIFIIVILLLVVGFVVFYVAAIRNSDNRPTSVETPSILFKE